jgi:hypothetical protein
VWLGQPIRFQAGHPEPRLPDLPREETTQLHAAAAKLAAAFTHLTATKEPAHDATAVHVRIANATIRITGPAVTTGWARRYYAPSWGVTTVPADDATDIPGVAARLIDSDEYAALADRVTRAPHRDVTYARKSMLLADLDEAITAVCPAERLAYRSHPENGTLHIAGCDSETLATAVARLAREMVRGQLIRDGWSLLHASAISRKDRVMLAFGGKGSGKTTTALTLTRTGEWDLLANDRVFVRAQDDRVRVLPWPSAAAVGLGLLNALGWYDIVRERLLAGEALHPTQDTRVTDALLRGHRTPLRDGGRELKAQLWPVQFTEWFGVSLAQEGDAAALLFPQVDAATDQPRPTQSARSLSDDDFMAKAEDRYPDIFQLVRAQIGGHDSSRARAAAHLQALPHHGLTLTHDVDANAELLAALLKH